MENVIDLTGSDSLFALGSLLPHMVYPNDGPKREGFETWMWAHIVPFDQLTEIEKSQILDIPWHGVEKDLEHAAIRGYVAGAVLLILLIMEEAKIEKKALLEKAFFLTSYILRSKSEKNVFAVSSDTFIRKYWHEYRNVAHLWGAMVMLFRRYEVYNVQDDAVKPLEISFSDKKSIILKVLGSLLLNFKYLEEQISIENELGENLQPINGARFAAVAHSLHDSAGKIRIPRARMGILPKTALKIIGVDLVPLALPNCLANYQEILEKFEPRYK